MLVQTLKIPDSIDIIEAITDNNILLVTKAIDKIMTGEGIQQQDLIISKLLRQDIEKYKNLFPHVSAAIQLLINTEGGIDKYPTK